MIQKRDFWIYVLLSIVTCGIYGIYFWYCWTEDVNQLCAGDGEESMNYIFVWLLSIVTCGIYGLYWYYKQANRLKRAAVQRYGVDFPEDGTTILLWLVIGCLLCGLGAYYAQYLLIRNTNTMADVYNGMIGGGGYYNGGSADQTYQNSQTYQQPNQNDQTMYQQSNQNDQTMYQQPYQNDQTTYEQPVQPTVIPVPPVIDEPQSEETQPQTADETKCIICGAAIPDGAKFCTVCGAPQNPEA